MTRRVVISCRQMQDVLPAFRERLEAAELELSVPAVVQQLTEAELSEHLDGAVGIIAGDDPLTADVIEGATDLRIISKWGVGTDGIDRAAAERRGIAVTNTPDVFGEEVADAALGYVVCLARQLHVVDAGVRAGGWPKPRGTTLAGKAMGVVGFGSIGRAVVRRARAFGFDVAVTDPSPDAAAHAAEQGVPLLGLDALLARSHWVVLCCPLTLATHHLLDERTLALLPDGAYVVNVSRGPLVHEPALVRALAEGRVAAAALDVFETEPLPPDSPLLAFPGCVLGSHNASNTHEGVLRASEHAVANLLAHL